MDTHTQNTTAENKKTKVLIIEDVESTGQLLKGILEKFNYDVTQVAINYDEALDSVEENPPHLAICDINIGYPDGITAAQDINKKLRQPIPIIYLTAHTEDDYRKRAYQTNPANYLIKSTELATQDYQLDAAIQLALSNQDKKETESVTSRVSGEYYDIWIKGIIRRVKIAEILYLEADNVSTKIITQSKIVTNASKSLGKTMEELVHPDIIKCHRSYAINLRKIEEYDSGVTFVILDKSDLKIKEEIKKVIPVGKKYKDEVKKALKLS